jgi:hypothetical protein
MTRVLHISLADVRRGKGRPERRRRAAISARTLRAVLRT